MRNYTNNNSGSIILKIIVGIVGLFVLIAVAKTVVAIVGAILFLAVIAIGMMAILRLFGRNNNRY